LETLSFALQQVLFIIDQNPNKPILLREIAQGNKKVTSKSNIINRIETR
jgi:hypothetical protein